MKLSEKRLYPLLVALCAALALIVTGCGSDDGDSGTTTAAAETETTTPAEGETTTPTGGSESDRPAENGDDAGDAGADGGQPPADDDFVAAVVDVCERIQSESQEAGLDEPVAVDEDAGPEAFATDLVKRFDKLNEIFTAAFADLREITPPAAQSDDYEEFLTTNERLLALTQQTVDKFADDPEFTMSEADLQKQQQLGNKHERLLGTLGLPEDCFDSAPS